MAEEVNTVYLQDKWAKMEARNLKRFVTAVGGLSALELTRLGDEAQGSIAEEVRRGYAASVEAWSGEETFHRGECGGVA